VLFFVSASPVMLVGRSLMLIWPPPRASEMSKVFGPARRRRTSTVGQSAGSCGANVTVSPKPETSMPSSPRRSGVTVIASDQT
jgi:hypothetical protein